MNIALLHALSTCETDLDGAMSRFSGNEELYLRCLTDFLKDETMHELEDAIRRKDWDCAFTAAHAIKGLAGNMGFVPLFHASAEFVVRLRAGRVGEIGEAFLALRRSYNEITAAIRRPLEVEKGERS